MKSGENSYKIITMCIFVCLRWMNVNTAVQFGGFLKKI